MLQFFDTVECLRPYPPSVSLPIVRFNYENIFDGERRVWCRAGSLLELSYSARQQRTLPLQICLRKSGGRKVKLVREGSVMLKANDLVSMSSGGTPATCDKAMSTTTKTDASRQWPSCRQLTAGEWRALPRPIGPHHAADVAIGAPTVSHRVSLLILPRAAKGGRREPP